MKQSGMRLKSQGACLLIFASAFAAASSSFPACLGQSPTTTTAPATSPSPVPASPATGTGGGRLTDLPIPPFVTTPGVQPAKPAATKTARPAAAPASSPDSGSGGGSLDPASAPLAPATAPAGETPQAEPAPSPHISATGNAPVRTTAASAASQTQRFPTAPNNEVAEAETPARPGQTGIKVHGHWVLQIKHSDGTFGEKREFENSLSVFGAPQPGGSSFGCRDSGRLVCGP